MNDDPEDVGLRGSLELGIAGAFKEVVAEGLLAKIETKSRAQTWRIAPSLTHAAARPVSRTGRQHARRIRPSLRHCQ